MERNGHNIPRIPSFLEHIIFRHVTHSDYHSVYHPVNDSDWLAICIESVIINQFVNEVLSVSDKFEYLTGVTNVERATHEYCWLDVSRVKIREIQHTIQMQ